MNQIKPSQPSQLKSKWTAVIVIRVCYKNITADRAYIATKKKISVNEDKGVRYSLESP